MSSLLIRLVICLCILYAILPWNSFIMLCAGGLLLLLWQSRSVLWECFREWSWRCPGRSKRHGIDCGSWMYCHDCGLRQFSDGSVDNPREQFYHDLGTAFLKVYEQWQRQHLC